MNRREFLKSLFATTALGVVMSSSTARALTRQAEVIFPQVPVGYISIFSGDAKSIKYMIKSDLAFIPCDGRKLSRHEFPALFSVLQQAYSQPDTNTLRVPNLSITL